MSDLRFNFQDRFGEARDGIRYRIRRTLTVANLLATLRTLLWLAPLTVLVWYTAESSRRDTETLSAEVTVDTPDTNRTVVRVEPRIIQVQIRGTPSQREQFRARIRESLRLTLNDASEIGLVIHPAEPLVAASPTRRESGVTVQRVTPAELRVTVDEVIQRELVVTPPESVDNLQSATFDPPTVVVRGPASVIRAVEASGTLVATADIAALPILRTPGKKDPLRVAVRSPLLNSPDVTLTPDSVMATLDVRDSDVSFKIDSVSVFASLPAGFLDDYRVAVEPQYIYNVTVYGPPDAIENLRPQAASQVIARIDFLPADVIAIRGGQTTGSKQPRFMVPEGIRVDPELVKDTSINWTAQRREN